VFAVTAALRFWLWKPVQKPFLVLCNAWETSMLFGMCLFGGGWCSWFSVSFSGSAWLCFPEVSSLIWKRLLRVFKIARISVVRAIMLVLQVFLVTSGLIFSMFLLTKSKNIYFCN